MLKNSILHKNKTYYGGCLLMENQQFTSAYMHICTKQKKCLLHIWRKLNSQLKLTKHTNILSNANVFSLVPLF